MLVFPTPQCRLCEWEDLALVDALEPWIDSGALQLVCVDSVDSESWYANGHPPAERVARHLQYERYLLDDVMPRLPGPPVAAGASFGALHSVLLAARHPTRIGGVTAPSAAPHTPPRLGGPRAYNRHIYQLPPVLPRPPP